MKLLNFDCVGVHIASVPEFIVMLKCFLFICSSAEPTRTAVMEEVTIPKSVYKRFYGTFGSSLYNIQCQYTL